MSVTEPNSIDVVVPDNRDGEVELVVVDQLPWKINEDDHLAMLQEKINTYLAFVETGQLIKEFPTAKDRKIVLKINALYAPSAEGEKFLAVARPTVGYLGIELRFDLWAKDRLSPDFPPLKDD